MILESENHYRRLLPMVRAAATKKQRAEVGVYLSQLPKVRLQLPDRRVNFFNVKIVRIVAGDGLDYGNLVGACKSTQDEIAKWLGVDDRDRVVRFDYAQQRCRVPKGRPGAYCRIEIRDLEPGGEVARVLGGAPTELGEEAEQNPPPLGKRKPPPNLAQPRLPIRTVWQALPWEQVPGEPLVADELTAFAGVDRPPATRQVRIPDGWHPPTLRDITAGPGIPPTFTLWLTEFFDPELGQLWLYRARPPVTFTDSPRIERTL